MNLMNTKREPRTAYDVADSWSNFCGVGCAWVKWMVSFGSLGGLVIWYEGYPQSKSAIPLVFVLLDPHGKRISENRSRLKDIKEAIRILQGRTAIAAKGGTDRG